MVLDSIGRAFYFGHRSPRVIRVSALWSLGLPSEGGEKSQWSLKIIFFWANLAEFQPVSTLLEQNPSLKMARSPQEGVRKEKTMGPKVTTMAQFAWDFPVLKTGCSTFWEDLAKQCGWAP